jgi:hypothetical protein
VSIQILNRLPSIIFLQWVVFPDHQVMISFSAFVWTCKDVLNSPGNFFFWNEHLNSVTASNELVGVLTTFRVPDKVNKGVWSLVCANSFPPLFFLPILGGKFCFSKENSRPYRVNRRCLLHPHFRAHVQLNVCSLGDRVQHSSFCVFCMLVIC